MAAATAAESRTLAAAVATAEREEARPGDGGGAIEREVILSTAAAAATEAVGRALARERLGCADDGEEDGGVPDRSRMVEEAIAPPAAPREMPPTCCGLAIGAARDAEPEAAAEGASRVAPPSTNPEAGLVVAPSINPAAAAETAAGRGLVEAPSTRPGPDAVGLAAALVGTSTTPIRMTVSSWICVGRGGRV